MKDTIYIIGHKNPDTDSICAAIAYSEFKNKIGNNAIPARLGALNRETSFVLDYFNVQMPILISNVNPQISDLLIDDTFPISPDASIKSVWNIMKKNSLRSLPVVDEDNKLMGIISTSQIVNNTLDIWDTGVLYKGGTTIDNILDAVSGHIVNKAYENFTPIGKVIMATMKEETLNENIEDNDIIICGDDEKIQNIIASSCASLMIVTSKKDVSSEIIETANKNNVLIIATPFDAFTVARLIPQSIPIGYIMTSEDLVYFEQNDYIEDVKEEMLKTRYRSYPVVNAASEVIGSISRFHLITGNKKKVILVDHNEHTQAVEGLQNAEVLEIIDHHRIADIQTGLPVYFRNEPVGSTSTIVSSIFFENGIRPSKKIAGILSAAIISDTLLFKSPTATNTDKINLKRLASIANLDVEDFASKMFKAGTSLSNKTIEEIFKGDCKDFTLSSKKIGVSQFITLDTDGFKPLKEEMLYYMEKICASENYTLLILLLTDFVVGGSYILA
ncbi:MAG: putative manganese-dependent inorganic diphosphatase, partial [Oscillospiraceae bacterium]|nr:putative manganese-dependent inorganic diphosphatase [Oscillospiraceae bacterium]